MEIDGDNPITHIASVRLLELIRHSKNNGHLILVIFLGALSGRLLGSQRPYFASSTFSYIFYVKIFGTAWTMTKVVTSAAAPLMPSTTPLRGDS